MITSTINYHTLANFREVLRVLQYGSQEERDFYFKMIELYQAEPRKTLALLTALMKAQLENWDNRQLEAELQRIRATPEDQQSDENLIF